ncbi:filamentous hemagglutinin outer membrane protein (plasmid) [Calothrix brevissima NIES-22]|nr:filamentous hemagglutinin outer membrane protein [Calothrix brevissima NIES-22]
MRDAVTISGASSTIFGSLGTGAIGSAGDIKVEAENVLINDGGEISSSTFGQGDSGNIFITARDAISLDAASYIYNNVQSSDAVGNAGNIDIITGSLSLTNGAQINSFTRGQGNAGNITITARDTVTFDGQDSNSNQSGLFSVVGNDAVGNGGTVSITSGSLSLNNGGRFGIYVSDTSDALQGKKAIGGTANINVRDAFTISGEGSGIFASLGSGVVGAGGDVNIKAGNLLIQDAGEISSFLGYGAQGRGGDVSIQVGNLLIKNGGQINSSTFGQGDSGNIFITARDVISLDTASYIYNNVQSSDAVGNAGNIDITTGSLAVTNGAQINSFTRGIGNAGNINIQARDVVFVDGRGLLSSAVDSSAVGNAGKIDILTDSLSLTNGAQIVSSTLGKGDAGDITIQAKGTVIVDGFIPLNDKSSYFTVLLSNVGSGAVGNGGNIDITAGSLSLTNGGKLLVDVDKKTNTLPGGQGNAGNVNINVRDAFTISGTDSGIFGSLDAGAVGRGGNIKVQAGNVFIKDVGQIAAYTDGQGDAGNISITSRDAFSLDKSIIANLVLSGEAIGNAGKIDITTGSLSLTNGAQISSATRGRGNAGNITIQAKDRVTLDGFQFFDNESNTAYAGVFSDVNAGAIGNGGDISITAGSLSLTNGGQLGVGVDKKTNTLPGGQGIGGTVNINVRDAVTISGASSTIFGSLGTGAIGSAGDIKVEAENVLINDGGEISSSTFGQGDSGNIFITARDAISLDAASYIYNNVQSSDAVGNAGNIDIITGSLSLTNGAQINSFTRGQGNAGNITITARDTVTFDGQDSNSNQSGLFSVVGNDAVGNGGTVSITSGSLSLNNGGSLGIYVSDASDALQGKKAIGGTANINVHDAFKISGEGSGIFASLGSGVVGTGGNIKIKARNISIQDAGEMSSNNYGRGNAGNIDITTDSLNITNRAGIFAGTFDEGNGGNITVEARDLVEILSDSNLDSGVEQSARGNAGDVTIKTGRLIVRNSQIGPSTFGEGNAGNFKIIATDSVELSGQIPKREGDTSQEGSVGFPGGLLAQIDVLGKGRAGNLTIETNRLSVSDGSKIQAATFGDGDAGNIFIRADEIELFETEKPNFYSTGIFAGVQTDGRIDTGIIDPRNGRPPKGQGGNLTIETRTLSLRNGAEVFVQTTGEGDAGKIFIRASESVNVTGISTGFLERQRTSTITASASETSTGNGGSLTIETPLLNITDGGFISSSSDGKGIAGDINISGDITRLNNGKIIAQTASTDGGNINFNLSQYLLLRNGSQISTTAGTAQAGGNGGNITINTPFIVAAPNENSDITANAFSGAGGNINIFTQNIFGINSRLKPSPQTNDITASSELGVQGQIEIQQPEVQPTQELIQLPNEFIDASTKFSQICPRDPNPKPLGKFIVTGRGSLPPSPLESMTGTNIRIPLATLEEQTATSIDGIVPVSNNATSEIIEAQGMVKTATGEIALVTNAPQATPISRPVATVCPVSR